MTIREPACRLLLLLPSPRLPPLDLTLLSPRKQGPSSLPADSARKSIAASISHLQRKKLLLFPWPSRTHYTSESVRILNSAQRKRSGREPDAPATYGPPYRTRGLEEPVSVEDRGRVGRQRKKQRHSHILSVCLPTSPPKLKTPQTPHANLP